MKHLPKPATPDLEAVLWTLASLDPFNAPAGLCGFDEHASNRLESLSHKPAGVTVNRLGVVVEVRS